MPNYNMRRRMPGRRSKWYSDYDEAIPDIIHVYRFASKLYGEEKIKAVTIVTTKYKKYKRMSRRLGSFNIETEHISIYLKNIVTLKNEIWANLLDMVRVSIHELTHYHRQHDIYYTIKNGTRHAVELDCEMRTMVFMKNHALEISREFFIDIDYVMDYVKCKIFNVLGRYYRFRDCNGVNRIESLDMYMDKIMLNFESYASRCVKEIPYYNPINEPVNKGVK